MRLSVLYLTDIPSPYRVSFFNELGKLCDLTVLFEKKFSTGREVSWHNYEFNNFKGIFLKGIKIKSNHVLSPGVIKYLKKSHYDLIVIGGYSTPTGMFAINYLNLRKIPFILSIDGGMPNKDENRIKYAIKKHFIASAGAWLSTGKIGSSYLEYYGARKENIYIYPFSTLKEENIIEKPLTINEKQKIRNELYIPYSEMILSVGQFIHRKGFDVLIEASQGFNKDTGVYIVGGTPIKKYVDIINHNNIENIHFIDFLEYKELKKYYLAADAFVFPTREDIWGLVINEAMANALPVITTTSCIAGLEMVENDRNGYLIPKNDVNKVIEKTNYILDNKPLKEKMAHNNLTKAREYTIENMAKTTYEILHNLRF